MDEELISLYNPESDYTRQFKKNHAENILNRQVEKKTIGGWELPKDSKYTFKNGKIISLRSDSGFKNTKKQNFLSEGPETSGEA